MTKLDDHFVANDACYAGRKWVSENCATASECWEKLLTESRIDWALWWYVRDRGFDSRAAELARRLALRTAREHISDTLEIARDHEAADRLRAIPDSASLEEIALAARADRAALAGLADIADRAARADIASLADRADRADRAAIAALAGLADIAAIAARADIADERNQQVIDIRELLECPWTEEHAQ